MKDNIDKEVDEAIARSEAEEQKWKLKENKDGDMVFNTSDYRIQTLDDVIRIAGIDTSIFECTEQQCTAWDVSGKFGNVGEEDWNTRQNYRFMAKFKRIIPKHVTQYFEHFLERMDEYSFDFGDIYRDTVDDPFLGVASFPDAHIGMYSWINETGEDYDTDIACKLFKFAGRELINRAKGYEFDKLVITVGSDTLHANDPTNLTPRGQNRLDVDDRLPRVFDSVADAYIELIGFLLNYTNVDVVWVAGNHDPESSWYVAKYLSKAYDNVKEVNFDVSFQPRKKVKYGKNLIGFTHGDEEKEQHLPNIMATQWAKDWGKTKYHTWFKGHIHSRKKTYTTSVAEHEGVQIYTLPSLSAKDAWTNRKGYFAIRSADLHIFSKEHGPSGYFTVNVEDNDIWRRK